MTTTPMIGRIPKHGSWGKRPALIPGMTTFHRGVDIAAPTGTPVVAPEAGVVTASRYNLIRGHYVVIDHGGGWSTSSQHLSQRLVVVGERVIQWQVVGLCGRTGNVTGPHDHTEVRWQGTPIDPTPWYAARGVTLGAADAAVKPAPPAVAPTPTPTTTVQLEMIDMRQAITDVFVLHTGLPPDEHQVQYYTDFWMLHGAPATTVAIRDSDAGQVAAAFRDTMGRPPESRKVVDDYLAQFGHDWQKLRDELAKSPEGLAYAAAHR